MFSSAKLMQTPKSSIIPVTFASAGAGNYNNLSSVTEAHNISADANAIVIGVGFETNAGDITGVTVGGEAATLLDKVQYHVGGGWAEWALLYGLLNPPKGNQNVVATFGSNVYSVIKSLAYNNVGSFGPPVKNSAANNNATLTVPSSANSMVASVFQAYTTNFSDYRVNGVSSTPRMNQAYQPGWNLAFLMGDAPGADSVNFTADTATYWGGVGVSLNPA